MRLILGLRPGRFALEWDRMLLHYFSPRAAESELKALVVGSGFEPLKAKPADLQSAPIGHSGNPPLELSPC